MLQPPSTHSRTQATRPLAPHLHRGGRGQVLQVAQRQTRRQREPVRPVSGFVCVRMRPVTPNERTLRHHQRSGWMRKPVRSRRPSSTPAALLRNCHAHLLRASASRLPSRCASTVTMSALKPRDSASVTHRRTTSRFLKAACHGDALGGSSWRRDLHLPHWRSETVPVACRASHELRPSQATPYIGPAAPGVRAHCPPDDVELEDTVVVPRLLDLLQRRRRDGGEGEGHAGGGSGAAGGHLPARVRQAVHGHGRHPHRHGGADACGSGVWGFGVR